MSIRWDSETDWESSQDSSGTTGRNGELKQGYSRDRPPLSQDLIGYWPLHDDSATDYSGNNNHGSLNGGITTGVAGKGGLQAMSFDGSDDYVDVSGAENSSFPVTISAWVKADGTGRIYSESTSSNGDNILALDIGGDPATASLYLRGQQNTPVTSKGNTEVIGEWHHIVGVATANELRIYVNGELENTQLHSRPFPNASNAQIGRLLYSSGSISHLDGVIAQCSTYNRALSNSEIQTLYEWGSGDYARPPTDSDGGVAYWPLDGNADDQWSTNDATLNKISFGNGIRGQSASFNGTSSYIETSNTSNLPTGDTSMSISLWFKKGATGKQGIATWGTGGSSSDVFGFIEQDLDGDNSETIYVQGWGSSYDWNTGYVAPKNEWIFISATYDGNTTKFYVNGSLNSSTSSKNWSPTDNAVVIGAEADITNYFNGNIDDVRIYNKALTPQEVFQIYRYGTRGRDMRKFLVNQ